MHLKDVDTAIAAGVSRRATLSYLEAVRAGLYTPLGDGDLDIAGCVHALEADGYGGWYVLEQDCALVGEPAPGAGPVGDVRAQHRLPRRDRRREARPQPSSGVAVVGFGWMGQVHARGLRAAAAPLPAACLAPRLVAVADAEPDRRAEAAARFGFVDDRRGLARRARPTTGSRRSASPRRTSCTARSARPSPRAGKHLWIEKPVGLSAADARAVADAVRGAGVQSAVGFNYRNAPAVEHARKLIADGAIGRVTNARLQLFADYAAHPHGALSWRFERALGGAGVLGDLASHGVDLARFLLGEIDGGRGRHRDVHRAAPGAHRAPAATFAIADGGERGDGRERGLPRLPAPLRRAVRAARWSPAGSASATSAPTASPCTARKGSLAWDFRRMGELVISSGDAYLNQPTEPRCSSARATATSPRSNPAPASRWATTT